MAVLGQRQAMPAIGYLPASSPGSAVAGGLDVFRERLGEVRCHFDTGSDHPAPQDYDSYVKTSSYIEGCGLPMTLTDKMLRHNAQKLFGFAH